MEPSVHIAGPETGGRQECSRCGYVMADRDFWPEGEFVIIDGLMEAQTTADGGTSGNTYLPCAPRGA